MIRAFMDTNVLASGFVGYRHQSGPPSELIRRWRDGQFELLTSIHVIAELQRTLQKPWFTRQLTPRQREAALALVETRGISVRHAQDVVRGIATHPEDDLILAATLVGEADYLVTGDRQLLALRSFGAARIISASDFVAILQDCNPEG